MARKRLLLFVVLLIGLAVVAAAVAPRDRDPFGTSRSETTPPPTSTTRRAPEIATIVRTLPGRDGRAEVVRAREGDLIRLVVNAPEPEQVIIGDNDRIEDAQPGTPARFEFFAGEPGTLPVRLGSGRLVGRIEIQARDEGARPTIDDAQATAA